MHPNIRKASVNWIDGMKVSKSHFHQTEHWVIDQLKDSIALGLTDNNYGLLPPSEDMDTSLDYQIEVEQTQYVKINLLSCRAITRGGVRIEITPYVSKQFNIDKNLLEVTFELKNASNQQYDIVISVDPYTKTPIGNPDPEEHPLRHPFGISKYLIDVVPSNQINTTEFSTYHLSIGKFRVVAGEVQLDDYIPPCTLLNSHVTLLEFYRDFEKQLNGIKQHLTQYIKKSRSSSEQGSNQNVTALAERILMSMVIFEGEFELELPYKSPLYLFMHHKRLIRLVFTELNCMPEDERLAVYNILNQSFTAGTFENIITAILHLKYSHRDIFGTLSQLFEHMSKFEEVISRLPFIGNNYNQGFQQPEKPKEPEPEKSTNKSGAKIFRGGQPIRR